MKYLFHRSVILRLFFATVFLGSFYPFKGFSQILLSGVQLEKPQLVKLSSEEIWTWDSSNENSFVSAVSIQPFFVTDDFKTTKTFEKKLRSYFLAAKSLGYFTEDSIVILPELLGLYLYFSNERESVYKASSLGDAGIQILLSFWNQPGRIFNLLSSSGRLPPGERYNLIKIVNKKLLVSKSQKVATDYQHVMSRLSKEFSVAIAAGSLPLPGAFVSTEGKLLVSPQRSMQNISLLFYKDGSLAPELGVKVHPTKGESEGLFIQPGTPEQLPVYNFSWGRVAIAICADTWYPDVFQALNQKKVDLLLVPSNLEGANIGDLPWNGYNSPKGSSVTPEDVRLSDVKFLTEWEAWLKYALLGRVDKYNIPYALGSFMKGSLWKAGFYGSPFIFSQTQKKTFSNDSTRATVARLRVLRKGNQ